MGKTKIEWATHSLNFIKWFCTKVSPGCKNCYMMSLAQRYPAAAADEPVWRPKAEQELKSLPAGAEVFVGDMYDIFHEQMSLEFIQRHFDLCAARPDVTFLFLTKRIERARELAPGLNIQPHMWLGTSVENSNYVWRIDVLRQIAGFGGRFISAEPLLGALGALDLTGIQQVITGGESGDARRSFYPAWALQIRDQCSTYGTAFFHKQGGHRYPGKDRVIDGQTYDALAWRQPGGLK